MDACLVHDMVRIAAERFPDRIALIEGTRTCSYAELDRESSRLAGWLREVLEDAWAQHRKEAPDDTPEPPEPLPAAQDLAQQPG